MKTMLLKLILTGLLALSFCISVRCGVFDDEATVRKARCYANCITVVSKIPINDSSCLSNQCIECKAPCDRDFISVENCTLSCPNSSLYCNQSCDFLGRIKNFSNIYEGDKSTIGKPGVVHNTNINVTTLTLSWEPSSNASGTVVYLLKEKMTGDREVNTPTPLKGLVFFEPKAVLTAKDACSIEPSVFRSTWNGISFSFTVVALTEVSTLVEGPLSTLVSFKKPEAVESLYNSSLFYNNDPSLRGDRLEFQVLFIPRNNLPVGTIYVASTQRKSGECGGFDVSRPIFKNENNRNSFKTQFFDTLKSCNISLTAHSVTECLPSKPKIIEHEYKGCHYLPSMNSSLCCSLRPKPLPESANAVRNLTYSRQVQSDFRFTVNITWSRPIQTCPGITTYKLLHYVKKPLPTNPNFMLPRVNYATDTFFTLTNLEPKLVREYTVTPIFKTFYDLGVPKTVVISTPEIQENQTFITNLHHVIQPPNSPSDRFALNISWIKPTFNYSRIEGYNVTYTVLGGLNKYNVTQQLQYVVKDLDYTQKVSYQVIPVYRDPWVITKAFKGTVSLPVLSDEDIKIRAFDNITEQSFVEDGNTKLYSLLVRWSPPAFERKVPYYQVSYSLTGYFDDELNCPSKRSPKRKCAPDKTANASYAISNIRQDERIEITVTPVFENTYAFQGKPRTKVVRSPGAVVVTKPPPMSSLQTALLVVGIILFLIIVVFFIVLYLRTKKRNDIENYKVDRRKGIVIDHWEVPPNNLDLIEVIGEGAFGKVYKGMLLDLPEQSTNTGSTSISFRRRSIRSVRSSKPDEGYVVAVKMLPESANDQETREFLKEIQLMKDVGSHRNIVNMLGCGTIAEPMYLIVEYLPNGDLLHYLRKRRGKAKQYPESDSRGPNHSTYCQAYFNMEKLREEASLEPNYKSFYVNTSINNGFQDDKEDDGGIQLKAVKKISQDEPALASYLASPEDEELDDETITSGDLMAFAWQVAQGMEYLSKRGYVHRDLAARNVLVGNSKEAKIADFGLTRHMYEDLYRAKTNRRLPLKWMSIEAIFDQTFTSQSDVWSFGVLLWEIVTLGGTPYPDKNNKELLNFLKEGKRMDKPETCDNEVYGIMMNCWKEKPEERATFVKIREHFEEMMMRDNPYFDPSSVDESRDYYNVPSFNSIQESDDGDDEVFNEILGYGKGDDNENQANGTAVSEKDEKLSESDKYEDELREKEPGIGDIESLLYRKQHHSIKNR